MARNFTLDSTRQRAMTEIYEKEATAQLENYLKSQKESGADSMKQSRLSEVLKNRIRMNGFGERLPKINTTVTKIHSKPNPVEEVKETENKTIENFGMLPPNPRVRSFLYSGFSKEGKGRYSFICTH